MFFVNLIFNAAVENNKKNKTNVNQMAKFSQITVDRNWKAEIL